MPIEIRTATPLDATAICDVVRRSIAQCCLADHNNDPLIVSKWLENKTPENALAWIQSAASIALLAARGGVAVGFALCKGDELALCYVVPEALHQGVGKLLLQSMESHAIARGVVALRLESTRSAKNFYLRNGFTSFGPTQAWAGMECQPMLKHLIPQQMGSPEPAYLGDMQIVARHLSPTEAYLLRSCLQAAGVPAQVGDVHLVQMHGLLAGAVGGACIRVPSSCVAEAKDAIAALGRGDFSLQDDFDVDV